MSIGDKSVVLEVVGRTHSYHCEDAPRLATLIESGRCALKGDTVIFGLLSELGVLVVPASDEDATLAPRPSINPAVLVLKNGAATHSPTEGGAWHLFGVTYLTSQFDE